MAITPRHLLHLLKKYMDPDDLAEMAPSLRKLVTRGDGAIPDEIVDIQIPPRVTDDPIITGLREKLNVPRRTPEPDILQENFRSMMSDPDTADIITNMYLDEYSGNVPDAAEALNEIALKKIRDLDDKLNALVRTPQGREIIGSNTDFRDLPPRSEISDLNRNLNRLRNEENKAYIFRQVLEGASEFPNMRMRVGDKIRDVSADARNWRLAESLAQGIKKTAINAPLLFLSNYLINRSFETPEEEMVVQY